MPVTGCISCLLESLGGGWWSRAELKKKNHWERAMKSWCQNHLAKSLHPDTEWHELLNISLLMPFILKNLDDITEAELVISMITKADTIWRFWSKDEALINAHSNCWTNGFISTFLSLLLFGKTFLSDWFLRRRFFFLRYKAKSNSPTFTRGLANWLHCKASVIAPHRSYSRPCVSLNERMKALEAEVEANEMEQKE